MLNDRSLESWELGQGFGSGENLTQVMSSYGEHFQLHGQLWP